MVGLIFLVGMPQNIASAKTLKSCGAASFAGARVLQNVVCKDGSPNTSATNKLRVITPLMMKLKKSDTMRQIYSAICKDWASSTGPDLMVTYSYLAALYDWRDKIHLAVYGNYPNCSKY